MRRKWSFVGEAVQTAHSEALENVKSINRELLVAAGADIPAQAARLLNEARELVLIAVRALQSNTRASRVPVVELPVALFKAAAERAERKFDVLFRPILVRLAVPTPGPLPSKLNGRRKRQSLGCL